MLEPLSKPHLNICDPDNLSVFKNNGCLDDRQHWVSTKGAFHQSFDERNQNSVEEFSNSCVDLNDPNRFSMKRRSAFSSSVARNNAFSSGCSGRTNSPGCSAATGKGNNVRTSGGRSLQSSLDSNDVGQISMNLMRVNGAIAPFKALLTSLTNPPDPLSPTASIKAGRSASSQYLSGSVSPKKLHKIGSHYVLENANRKESSITRLFDAPIVNVEREQDSKKSLSLVLSEDLEGQRTTNDDSESPLMKRKETSGGRLIRRQLLFHVRRVTSDYALFFAAIGIGLMIIDNEMNAAKIYQRGSYTSLILKALILLSTIILVILVIKFHVHEVQLFMNANSAEDWRIAVTWQRGLQIVLEVMVCALCPLPIDINFYWTASDGDTMKTVELPLNVLLSIPMFFRLYWLCRVMLLHSRLFTDASSRSIAGLNRVNFNARFILKTLMTLCPGTVLMIFTASLWVIAGWILRLCERHDTVDPINIHSQKHQDYLNSLWLIAITFLSVGYGDIVPNTYCGRAMAVITGILGTCTSSMVVAVIARKLELTRAEKHVHNFMMDTQLTKQLKHTAANVLRETWLIYKHRCLVDKIEPAKIRMHQRKFLVAIYALRKVKRDQRKLAENSVSLGDVAKTTSNTYEMVHDVQNNQEGLSLRMTAMEYQLADINRELSALVEFLRPNRILKNASLTTSGIINSHDNTVRRRCNAVEVES
uniref:Calmodulin-binding domain-containing protein n=3 Tax=Wuchereria bancrofti TaxID=6293 RepID=A0AAF5Q1Y5_WUCBA